MARHPIPTPASARLKAAFFHHAWANPAKTVRQLAEDFGYSTRYAKALLASLKNPAKRTVPHGRPRSLTPDQLEQILFALAQGVTKPRLAAHFGVSLRTLYNHLARLKRQGKAGAGP